MANHIVPSHLQDNKIFPLRPHPLSLLFPDQADEEYEALKRSIEANGLRHPIIVHDGQILDGRHRYRACRELGTEPRLEQLPEGEDPLTYVIDLNATHRHLTISQRALIAAGMVQTEHGGQDSNQYTKKQQDINAEFAKENSADKEHILSRAAAAKLFGVSKYSVDRALYVLKHGDVEMIRRIKSGELRLRAAEGTVRAKIAREKAAAEAMRAAVDDKPVETDLLVDPEPVERDPGLSPLTEAEYEAKKAMQEAWAEKQIAAWEAAEQEAPVSLDDLDSEADVREEQLLQWERKNGTETSAFGTTGRINHDSSKFYNSRLYEGLSYGGEVEYRENPIDTDNLNRIFCKSSVSMDELPDSSVHLMVTSPPYNVGKQYDDDLSLDEYRALLTSVFQETYRVLVPGGRVCINVANLGRKPYLPLHSFIIEDMHQIGFKMRGDILWNKGSSASASTAWGTWLKATNPVLRDIHEYILVFCKDTFTRKNPSKRASTISEEEFLEFTESIWSFPAERATEIGHPAPFPLELPYRIIQLYTFAEDVVLDPFVGSGTSCLAAVKTGRRYVGYDIDEAYCSLAEQRIEEFRNKQRQLLAETKGQTRGRDYD